MFTGEKRHQITMDPAEHPQPGPDVLGRTGSRGCTWCGGCNMHPSAALATRPPPWLLVQCHGCAALKLHPKIKCQAILDTHSGGNSHQRSLYLAK